MIYWLPLRVVAVHAAVVGLSAGLSAHVPVQLHRHAGLRAPLDGRALLLLALPLWFRRQAEGWKEVFWSDIKRWPRNAEEVLIHFRSNRRRAFGLQADWKPESCWNRQHLVSDSKAKFEKKKKMTQRHKLKKDELRWQKKSKLYKEGGFIIYRAKIKIKKYICKVVMHYYNVKVLVYNTSNGN